MDLDWLNHLPPQISGLAALIVALGIAVPAITGYFKQVRAEPDAPHISRSDMNAIALSLDAQALKELRDELRRGNEAHTKALADGLAQITTAIRAKRQL